MQNRYLGDIGDFTKYLLLNYFSQSALKVGVNWYLVEPSERELQRNPGDGRHTDYLKTDKLNISRVAPEIFDKLRELVFSNKRDLLSLVESNVLPRISFYYSKPVETKSKRIAWFERGLLALMGCDILFLDPDNGIVPKSISPNGLRAKKYVLFEEIKRMYSVEKKSLIIYQHTNRTVKVTQQIESKISSIESILAIQNRNLVDAIYTGKGTSRFYIIVKQPIHSAEMDSSLNTILKKCVGLKLLGLFNRNSSEIEF